jgi:ribose-phosphate pyrophosphokinase
MAETLNLVKPNDNLSLKYEISRFPDGQQSLTIKPNENYDNLPALNGRTNPITIKSRLNDFRDLELIICANQALKELGVKNIRLHIPYCIGGRSDRKFEAGGINYIKTVIAPIINSQNFEEVRIMDPHSDVLEACIDNIKIINHSELIGKAFYNMGFDSWEDIGNDVVLVSPDAGALKKVFKIQQNFRIKNLIIGAKNRDIKGQITHTSISGEVENPQDKTFVIVDDICDGGRTFIELAKVIKAMYGDVKVMLIVTHGIFSKGLGVMLEYVDQIYTTNSVNEWSTDYDNFPLHKRLHQYEIYNGWFNEIKPKELV